MHSYLCMCYSVYEKSVDVCIDTEKMYQRHRQDTHHIVMSELFKALTQLIKTLYVVCDGSEVF